MTIKHHLKSALLVGLGIIILLTAIPGEPQAQILGGEKRILEFTKSNWVTFRNYNGQQLIYFTHLVAYRCGIAKVSFSINSDKLDETYDMPECDEDNPNAIPKTHDPYISMRLGSAHEIYLQLTFSDGSKSQVLRKTP